jgi:hypothetical protein
MRPGRTTAGSPLRRAWRSSSGPSSSPTSSVALPIPPLPASGLRAATPVTAPSGLEGRGSRRGPQDPAELPLLLRQRRLQGRREAGGATAGRRFLGMVRGCVGPPPNGTTPDLASPRPNGTILSLLASPGAEKTPKTTSKLLCRPDGALVGSYRNKCN